LGVLYASSQGEDGLVVADTPGPVGVEDLPSLADQIAVADDETAVLVAPAARSKPRQRPRGTP
jgi:hypothetical protein